MDERCASCQRRSYHTAEAARQVADRNTARFGRLYRVRVWAADDVLTELRTPASTPRQGHTRYLESEVRVLLAAGEQTQGCAA